MSLNSVDKLEEIKVSFNRRLKGQGIYPHSEDAEIQWLIAEVSRLWALRAELEAYVDTLRKEKETADQHADKADMEVGRLMAQRDKLLETLKRISKGEGAFDLDPLKHAANCIDDMKSIAQDALEKNPKE